MNILIVYAHPEPKSFDGIMKDRAIAVLTQQGHAVQLSDLYKMRFKAVVSPDDFTDPVDERFFELRTEQSNASQYGTFTPDIITEQSKVLWAEMILFQFPLWWYAPPAILKGWFDRVLAYGFAYGQGRNLAGRRAMLVMTTGGPPRPYTPQMRDALCEILAPVQRDMLHFCGIDVLPPYAVYGAGNTSARQREELVLQYTRILRAIDQIRPLVFEG
jgi:NAD(P)H dehydrogenase (quinone)